MRPIDSFVIIGATTTSVLLYFTGFGLIVVRATARVACDLPIGKFVWDGYKKTKLQKQYEKDQRIINIWINFIENGHKKEKLLKKNKKLYVILLLKK